MHDMIQEFFSTVGQDMYAKRASKEVQASVTTITEVVVSIGVVHPSVLESAAPLSMLGLLVGAPSVAELAQEASRFDFTGDEAADAEILENLRHNVAAANLETFAEASMFDSLSIPSFVSTTDGSPCAMTPADGLMILKAWACVHDVCLVASWSRPWAPRPCAPTSISC